MGSAFRTQKNFSGSNTAVSNSLLESQTKQKNPIAVDINFGINLGDFLFYIDNGMLCVLIRIAWVRQF